MAQSEVPFSPTSMRPVIEAGEEARADFLVKVYQHLGLAVLAFVAIEAIFFVTGIAEFMFNFFLVNNSGFVWLALLGGMMILFNIAGAAAHRLDNTAVQYQALFAFAGGEALLFAPFLYLILVERGAPGDVVTAAVITLVGFAALTAVAMVTRRDLSFLRPLVFWGSIVALGLIVMSVLFGLHLGALFSLAMVGLMGASILYQTQKIVREYPEWAYVGAAVGLFSSLMTMFWYVLRLVAGRD